MVVGFECLAPIAVIYLLDDVVGWSWLGVVLTGNKKDSIFRVSRVSCLRGKKEQKSRVKLLHFNHSKHNVAIFHVGLVESGADSTTQHRI